MKRGETLFATHLKDDNLNFLLHANSFWVLISVKKILSALLLRISVLRGPSTG